jgi:1-acyl-sn-glycerol-3-phosphate acyltransferase
MIFFWKIVMKMIGWRIEGTLPEHEKKFVIVVAPHTSNWDFIVGVIVRGAMGFNASFLGKKSLFRKPFGLIFKGLGGIPVDRNTSQNLVDQVVEVVNKRDKFILAIAPEGTRGKVKKWRTGFYYIALYANIPVVMCQMDYANKVVCFLKPFFPSDNAERDLEFIRSHFTHIKGLKDL